MDPLLQSIEVEAMRGRDDDLAVEDTAWWQQRLEALLELGKVAIERTQIAALDEQARRPAEDNRAKAIPLRFVKKSLAFRQRVDGLREHRLDRRLDREAIRACLVGHIHVGGYGDATTLISQGRKRLDGRSKRQLNGRV